jgi:alpha-1,3-glucosyltransferase
VLVDFRGFLSTPVLVRLSLLLTLLLLAPVGWCLLAFPISTDSLLLALVNSSLAFFLASFQVHEKSLLLALVPAVFFCQRGVGGSGPLPLQAWFQVFGCFTMFPLLRRDNLALAYVACNILFIGLLFGVPSFESTASLPAVGLLGKWEDGLIGAFVVVSTAGALALHACEALLPPPARYPHLYPALISMYGAVNLLVFFTYTSILHRKVVSSSAKLKQR